MGQGDSNSKKIINMKTKPTKTRTELSHLYGVSYNTMLKLLADVPDIRLKKGQRIIFPVDLAKIYLYLGKPE